MPEQNQNLDFKTPPLVASPHKSFLMRHIVAEILALVIVVALGSGAYYWNTSKIVASKTVNSYESCIAAGYPMMKSYPAKCATPDGVTFVQVLNACIQVIQPAKNPKTGEIREFPTPCDVPEGWEKIK